ncbi:hypothetical protein ACFVYF_26460 [Streptomyces sp. NPDC058274]|uniref:hypothetical protein n=1 Tax=Streptomyces sp. NPDC058274 TaxID=3346416 RepID=UPI0036EA0C95
MFMRLCTSLSLAVAAAAAVTCGPAPNAAQAHAAQAHSSARDRRPTCATPGDRAFPLTTRVHGGPGAYEPGGGDGTWYIDLTNTTAHPCGNIHPVVLLVDRKRELRPAQVRLEFYEGTRPHAVPFTRTDDDELVGAFDGGFPGFTVAPGRTLSVKVRLTVTSDAAVPNDIVANAAVVQRHSNDGEWVGQSNDYRFRIDDDPDAPATEPASGHPTAPGDGVPDRTSAADELASTGPGAPHGLGVVVGGLLLAAGGVLLVISRRALRGRR